MRIACVYGRQESGMLVCSLPMLAAQFYYYEAKALRGLVTAYVQESLKQQTPQQLSRYLPPKNLLLEEITIAGGRRAAVSHHKIDLPQLKIVADPVGSDDMRRSFSRAYSRERQVAELVQLLQRERANVLLVGESGVGKTALLVDATREVERAQRVSKKETVATGDEGKDSSQDESHKFWLTSGPRLIAGMKYLGQWEERCERVVQELARIGGTLVVEYLAGLVSSGGVSATNSIAAFLLPYIQRGELRLIAETTPAGVDACRRLFPGFVEAFRIFPITTFSHNEALAALQAFCAATERNSKARIDADGLRLIYRLFQRFMPYEPFPGKTIGFTSRLYERAKKSITPDLIVAEFVKLTGLPEILLRDEVPLDGRDLQAFFQSEVIGQDEACRAATRTVLTFKAGLNDPARPLGVFLFTGPTGVGKTETARTVAKFLFGAAEDSERFVRLDMSEYLLMIMTSNLGARGSEPPGFGSADDGALSAYNRAAQSFFRPEFYNRIDAVVSFRALDRASVRSIVEKELAALSAREGLTKRKIKLTWTERLADHLAETGFNSRFGARPLQRTIEAQVVTPLAL